MSIDTILSDLFAQLPYYILLALFFYKERKEGEKILNTGKLVVDELRQESTADKSLSYKIMAEIRELTKDLLFPQAPVDPAPRPDHIDTKLDDIYEVVSNFRSEVGTDISNLSKQMTSFRTEFDDFVTRSTFRLERLEHYTLSRSDIEEYSDLTSFEDNTDDK